MGNNESKAVIWIAATVLTLYMGLTAIMENRYKAEKAALQPNRLEEARKRDKEDRDKRDSTYKQVGALSANKKVVKQAKKSKAIYAGADEQYPDEGYDEEYWSLRGYMSAYEMMGKHCPNQEAALIFYKRKERERKKFIEKISVAAIEACEGTTVPPSIVAAQAILESGYGTSRLSHKAKNLFGHMSHTDKLTEGIVGRIAAQDRSVSGKVQTYYFRVYKSHWWSIRHHVSLLERGYGHRRPRLAGMNERERWMAALCGCSDAGLKYIDAAKQANTKGGYLYAGACAWSAKDGRTSRYVAELRWVIESYGLEKLDSKWIRKNA
jgi:flagellum-specific peptidoglycan hydrolase FlgJ